MLISFQRNSEIVFRIMAWQFKGMTYICAVNDNIETDNIIK